MSRRNAAPRQLTEEEKQKLRDKNRAEAIERYTGCCLHFCSLFGNDTCKAGVRFDSVSDKPAPGWALRVPCLKEHGVDNCPSRRFPTMDEAIAYADRLQQHTKMVLAARTAITKQTGDQRRVSGSIECPQCGGVLRYSVAYNGHCHASCEKKGCLSWME